MFFSSSCLMENQEFCAYRYICSSFGKIRDIETFAGLKIERALRLEARNLAIGPAVSPSCGPDEPALFCTVTRPELYSIFVNNTIPIQYFQVLGQYNTIPMQYNI